MSSLELRTVLDTLVALTVGVPAGMGKDEVFAFGTSAKIEALADFIPAGSVCCSVNNGGVRLDWWTQRTAMGTLSQNERLLLVPPDGLFPALVLGCGTILLLVGLCRVKAYT